MSITCPDCGKQDCTNPHGDSNGERRWSILFVSYEHVFAMAFQPYPSMTHFRLSHITLPPDARVVAVHPNHSRFGFDFVIESSSFEPVPNGVEMPRYNAEITETIVERKTEP